MNVLLVDLKRQHESIQKELDEAIRTTINRCHFIGGPTVHGFEEDLAEWMGTRFAQGVASGTSAITIALRALQLPPGSEVITTPLTAIPTAEAVTLAGLRPVFADVEDDTLQIDPARIAAAITPRTRAIVVVHLYGLAAPVDKILGLARERNLAVIEDIAQAQGARLHGERLGTLGRAACLSFFPSKNLGAMGDGGAVVTDDEEIQRFVKMYCNHGRLEKFTHEIEGANERLDGLQAAILRVKLRYLEQWNAARRKIAQWYEEELGDIPQVRLPTPIPGSEPVWHIYAIRIAQRARLQEFLKEQGVGTGLHYPAPLHLQPAYAWMNQRPGSLPIAEKATQEVLSIPMHPLLERNEVACVCECIRLFYSSNH